MRMWMITQRGEVTEATSRELQLWVRQCGGLLLMATRSGPLVALEDDDAPKVEKHPLVEFMGPVALNPRGLAAKRLEAIFAENLSKQLDLDALRALEQAQQ
jgi:hypothetical protein